jgi:hypothetical protein
MSEVTFQAQRWNSVVRALQCHTRVILTLIPNLGLSIPDAGLTLTTLTPS